MFCVEKRDAATLLQIIQECVEKGTEIVTGGWAAYSRVSTLGYIHKVVIHKENFIDPVTGANTQRTECEWGHCKLLIMRGRRGTTLGLLQSHLDEYCFRKQFGNVAFYKWLRQCNNVVNYPSE